MLVGIAVQFGRRTVDEDDVPVVGKLQDTVHVVRVKLTDFVSRCSDEAYRFRPSYSAV